SKSCRRARCRIELQHSLRPLPCYESRQTVRRKSHRYWPKPVTEIGFRDQRTTDRIENPEFIGLLANDPQRAAIRLQRQTSRLCAYCYLNFLRQCRGIDAANGVAVGINTPNLVATAIEDNLR